MAQTSFGRRGRFWPTRRPLFHAMCEEALFVLISVDMVDLHARPLRPQRPRSAGRPSYCNRTELQDLVPLNSRCRAESRRFRYGEAAQERTIRLAPRALLGRPLP